MKTTFNVLEITQMAINIEKEGAIHYTSAAAHTEDERAKSLMLLLAEQERKHIALFQELQRLLSEIHDMDKEYLLDPQVSDFLRGMTENQVFNAEDLDNATKSLSPKAAILKGIQDEKNSILFYCDIFSRIEDKPVKDVLEIIIDEEKQHVVDLSNLLESL